MREAVPVEHNLSVGGVLITLEKEDTTHVVSTIKGYGLVSTQAYVLIPYLNIPFTLHSALLLSLRNSCEWVVWCPRVAIDKLKPIVK